VDQVNIVLQEMKVPVLRLPLKARYRPDDTVLEQCRNAGREVASQLQELSAA